MGISRVCVRASRARDAFTQHGLCCCSGGGGGGGKWFLMKTVFDESGFDELVFYPNTITADLVLHRAPLPTSWMLSMRVPRSVVISAHSHKVSLQSLFLLQRFQRSPVHSLVLHRVFQGLICLFQCHNLCQQFQSLQRPSHSRFLVLDQMHLHVMRHVQARLLPLLRPSHLLAPTVTIDSHFGLFSSPIGRSCLRHHGLFRLLSLLPILGSLHFVVSCIGWLICAKVTREKSEACVKNFHSCVS